MVVDPEQAVAHDITVLVETGELAHVAAVPLVEFETHVDRVARAGLVGPFAHVGDGQAGVRHGRPPRVVVVLDGPGPLAFVERDLAEGRVGGVEHERAVFGRHILPVVGVVRDVGRQC